MLSAPSSSRDASLPSNTSASSSTPASGAAATAAAPFDSVLAGLRPTQSRNTQGSPAKAAGSSPAKSDRADAESADSSASKGGQVWSAPANWLAPLAASLSEGEPSTEGDGQEPVATDGDAEADSADILAISLAPVLPPETARAAALSENPATPSDDGEVNADASGDRPASTALEEDMPDAFPASANALYGSATARGKTDVPAGAVNTRPGTGKGRNAGANEVAGAYATSPETTTKDATADAEVVGAAMESLPMESASDFDRAGVGMSPVAGDDPRASRIQTHSRLREGGGVFAPGASPTPLPDDAAPFAAQGDVAEPGQPDPELPPLENIVQHVATQVVNPALKALGIDPAKVGSTMEIVAADPSALTPDMTASQADAEIAAASTSAFDRVLQVVDAARPGERSAVNVRLDFGDAGPLNVHITMRDGRVHTMFRCDSPELRDTLATAWSRFVQKGDTAALPLAEPVMLPLRASTSSQDGGRQQENFNQAQSDGQPGRHAEARENARAGSQGRLLRRPAAASVITPAVSASSRGDSSSRLSALA